MEPFLADKIKNDAYQLYKKDWCESRGYVLEDVERAYLADEQYNGEMFASFEEFLVNEFKDTEYITTLFREVLRKTA